MASFVVNGKTIDVPDNLGDVPLLWYLREHLKMTGTKFGCGMAQCYACTVLVNGKVTTSCQVSVSDVAGATITTIEGLAVEGKLHPVQEAWVEKGVPQCGYCQSGQVLATVALLKTTPNPTDDQINKGLRLNLCRCGTYNDIRAAVKLAATKMAGTGGDQ